MWSLFRLFDDDCALTIMDIGASLGGQPDYQHLINVNRASLVAFEPDAEERGKLQLAYGARQRVLPYYVGDGGTATFHQTNWALTGSLYEPNTPLLERFRNLASVISVVAKQRVETVRLDDIADLGDVDFLKIDVQGAELAIFQNGLSVLDKAVMIQVEVNFLEQYRGQPMFSDVDTFLRKHGFQYHTIKGHGYRPFKPLANPRHPHKAFHQQIWSDAIYVRDWMHLEDLADGKLERYAVLLHDMVGSPDLAHVVLEELDRRRGTRLADSYRKRLVAAGTATIDAGEDVEAAGGIAATEAVAPDTAAAESWVLEAFDGLRFAVPPTPTCITTYVLLEQERWFEKESGFVGRCLNPGDLAIDIGANLGVYSLQMAKAVGDAGRVFCYEPGSDNRRHLEASLSLNGVAGVQVIPSALSSETREGWLQLAGSGELNRLASAADGSADGEAVSVTTLDAEAVRHGWARVAFVKIDAEGQEARIIAGGSRFLIEHSPLVMYEVQHGSSKNETLRWQLAMLGYATYRLTGDGGCLVPVDASEAADGAELNLFAAKPDRAADLERRGLLVPDLAGAGLLAGERETAIARMLETSFARAFEIDLESIDACPFGEALSDYAAYRFLDGMPAGRRYAALERACEGLLAYVANEESAAAQATLARCATDLGRTAIAARSLKWITERGSDVAIDQPFFPASLRYEGVDPGADPAKWFFAAALEQLLCASSYSTYFTEEFGRLKWLAECGFASAEILRRTLMVGFLQGLPRRDLETIRLALVPLQQANRAIWCRDLATLLGALEN